MSRISIISIVTIFLTFVLSLLLWFGHYFFTYIFLWNDLAVSDIASQERTLGESLALDLHGRGFDDKTVVSLFADVSHRDAVVGTFPLNGVYNEGLQFGDVLYLTRKKGGIVVLDIKDRTHPRLLKEYLSGRTIVDIHRHGNTLYLSCGKLGVSIMTVASDGLLEHVADIALTSTVWKTHFVDNYLYVAAGTGGLVVYDVHQLTHAIFVKKIAPHFSSNFVVQDQYLYLAAGKDRISIFEITHAGSPVLTGFLTFTDKLHDLAIYQNRLYIATEAGIYQYLLENPRSPQLYGHWDDFGSAEKLFSGEKHLYVSDSFSGFRIIDPTDVYSPGFINLSINPRMIVECDDYLYVAGADQGLLIIEKGRLASRSTIETMNTSGSAHDLWVRDHWLYVADAAGGILLKNLADQSSPFISLSKQRSESLTAMNNLLFVAQGRGGVEVFDISSPGKPSFVTYWPGLQGWRLAAGGQHVVVAKGAFGIDFVNVSDIYHPEIMDSIKGIHPLDVEMAGDTVYVVSKNDGLLIYQVTEGERLKRVGQLTTPFPMNQFDLSIALQVKDGIAYIANGRAGLLIVDVTDPVEPKILSSIDIPGVCKELKIVGKRVYAVSHRGGVSVVDVQDPENPMVLNTFSVPGLSRGIEIVDSLIYVAHNTMGVTIIPTPVVVDTVDVVSGREMRVKLPSPQKKGYYNVQISSPRESVVIERRILYKR